MESRKSTDSSVHGRHHAQNIYTKQMQLEFAISAGQDV